MKGGVMAFWFIMFVLFIIFVLVYGRPKKRY